MLTLARIFRFAFQSFWRNIWLSLVTIFIITLSFVSINFFVLSNSLIDASLQAIEQKINVTAYFTVNASEKQIANVKERVEQLSQTQSVELVSKDEALARMKKKYDDEGNQVILDSLKEFESNPLGASLVIKTKSVDDYPAILKILEESQYKGIIENKTYDNRDLLIQRISVLKRRVQEAGVIVNIFFLIIVALIVYNTIKITIYTRKDEAGIMKLVGATNSFIRAPLVLESAMYSFFALALSILITYPMLGVLQPYTDKLFDGMAFDVLDFFTRNFLTIFGLQLLGSLLLNMTSSGLAIGKYLKV